MPRLSAVITRAFFWLQRHSPLWPAALGLLCGAGLGATALWGLGGVLGVGMCLVVVGLVYRVAGKAEPVWLDEAISPAPKDAPGPAVLPWLPDPPPPLQEPLEMVSLPGGTFTMGAAAADTEAFADERPQHEVTISALWMGRYPVTRQLYRDVMGRGLSQWERDDVDGQWPASSVNWFEAVTFCNALSERVGLQPCYHVIGTQVTWDTMADGYRLPTEAEWEYACRAGTTTRWFCGDETTALARYAWFAGNADGRIHPVGEQEPNPWGLYDMSGNVWEWCWDWYGPYEARPGCDPEGPAEGVRRVLRGGATWNVPGVLRSSNRDWDAPVFRGVGAGFRCVRRPRRQL